MPDTSTPLLAIGELSRATGLSVSALRFYDRQGVLTPTHVDTWSGYRRYAREQVREGRLLAGMRRVQMPVAEMASALEAYRSGDHEVVQDLLSAHLRRLVEGLADARDEIARLTADLENPGEISTIPLVARVEADVLRESIAAVRHAIGTDPDFPALRCLCVEVDGNELTTVATDRYRLALTRTRVRTDPDSSGARTGIALLAASEVDRLDRWLTARGGEVHLVLEAELRVTQNGSDQLSLPIQSHDYPDYRQILPRRSPGEELVDHVTVQEALAADTEAVVVGPLTLNREFLGDALRHVPDAQVVIPADGVIAPLVIRSPQDRVLALVMPIAQETR